MTDEEIIEDILDEFDFEKVHKAMDLLEWTWGMTPECPTIGELRKCARSLMKSLINKEDGIIATGGFWATKKTFDGEPFYQLQFVLTGWDNYE